MGSVPPPAVPSRVLIGAELGPEVLAAFDAHPEVRVESEPRALLRRASEEAFVMVVVAEARAPFVFLRRSRLLELTGELASSLARGAAAWEATLRPLVKAFGGVEPVAADRAPGKAHLSSLLVRPRSPEEERDVRRRALEASFRERERLLEGSLSTQEVASLLGVTRQTPHDRVKAKTLLAIEHKGSLRFPPWQFDADNSGGVVKGLPEVLRALSVGALAQARWLQRRNPVFEGRSPFEALQAGELERVVREARGVGASAA